MSSIFKLEKRNIVPLILFFYFLLYAFLPAFIGKSDASIYKSVILVIMIFFTYSLSTCKNYLKTIKSILLPYSVAFFLIQFIVFYNYSIFRWIVNVFLFFLLIINGNYRIFLSWSIALRVVAFICTLSVLYNSWKNGIVAYFRQDVLIDKSYITAFYSISYYLCFIDIFYKKNVKTNIFLMVIFIFTNIVFVQSKTSMFAFLVEYVVCYSFFPKLRKQIRTITIYFVGVVFLCITALPKIPINEDLKFAINNVTGIEFFDENRFERNVSNLSATFDIRSDMRKYCFNLFYENPVLGIGYGNFSETNNHSSNYFSYLNQTESSWLQVLVDGGFVYLLYMIVLFFIPILVVYKRYKHNNQSPYLYYDLIGISFFLVFFVMYFFNDFSDSLFWISAAVSYSVIASEKKDYPAI